MWHFIRFFTVYQSTHLWVQHTMVEQFFFLFFFVFFWGGGGGGGGQNQGCIVHQWKNVKANFFFNLKM